MIPFQSHFSVSSERECSNQDETNLDMARSEIYKIRKSADALMKLTASADKMEPWMLSKLVKAFDYLHAVEGVLEYDEYEKEINSACSQVSEVPGDMFIVSKIKDMLQGEDRGVNEQVLKQVIFNLECLKEVE